MEKNTTPSPSVASSVTADDCAGRRFPSAEIHALARSYSRHSQKIASDDAATPRSPFDNAEGSKLDPASPNFSARAWTETMMKLQSEDPNNPTRRAGLSFRHLSAYGHGSSSDYQNTFSTAPMKLAGTLSGCKGERIDILHDMDGLVRSGEMLVVLGPPGSGCSTFLKTISGETGGFVADGDLNYEGISAKQMHHNFRGESIYTAEVDVHFPALTVGDTLYFAARARAPRHTPGNVSHHDYAEHVRDVTMAILGISHTINTNVGDDFVRGVSGGERKRVTIAEAMLAGAPLQCWDNSTRGLDSATALEFCRSLKLSTSISGKTACVSLYQAPQSAYNVFDKVTVLYEGRQIYFGRITDAKKFFTDMGFVCPERQTTADFLTSLTSELERKTQPGFEHSTPRTPDEFVRRWKESAEYKILLAEIEEYNQTFKIGGERLDMFIASRKAQQWKGQRIGSPYTLSYRKQIELCVWRGFRRLFGNPEMTLTQIIGNSIMALILSSVFFNLSSTTSSFFQRGALVFFSILMAAFASMLEMFTLYAQRNIVEKHTRYAFYHPSAEAFASMLCDLPYKSLNAITFSLVIYFMSNLRREAGNYFFFTFTSFLVTIAMSCMFRTIASASRSISQALAPSAVLILGLVIYTGFAIPTRDMRGWSSWLRYLNPIFWAFEALMVNEFHGRDFSCAAFVPMGEGYEAASGFNRVCSTVGSVPGSAVVSGDDFINASYEFYASNKWRNVGILFAFIIFFCSTYLAAAEYITAQKSKGEVLLFQHGHKKHLKRNDDLEAGSAPTKTASKAAKDVSMIPPQTAIFQWEDVVYNIKIKGEPRRILDRVDGWVKPGTLTALMGVSGAGKTTLLDVLATRVTMGVVTGKMLVDGHQRDDSFQRKTGYVQQQDLHLEISTVREALNFSALLRQPAHISREDKLTYVDEVIALLEMEAYAEAIVGVPGEGLNVEQRKRLTIGVELAAKPELLLFLDEPTSGLDSQTSWAICDLLAKLTAHGQAILCTIHQPSAMLFQRFDRLLFLAKGGRTVYFGEVGEGSHVLTKYFEKNGAHPCPADANPAEWMLEVIGAAPGSHTEIDWHQTWLESPERIAVKDELHRMEAERGGHKTEKMEVQEATTISEFAAPFSVQYRQVQKRIFQQYWRTPSYLYSKLFLLTASALFIGFSFFKASLSRQGLQNQMFSLFMLMVIFGDVCFQILPSFVVQRSLYEARERPSKTYSWKVFMLSNIVVEIPFNAVCALLVFICYYYPVGLWRNAEPTGAVHERGALFFLLLQQFLLFASTFAHMIIAGIDSAETASNLGNLLFILCLIFCGVLASPSSLPQFWIFLYRVSPFTYLIEGMLTTAVANTAVVCSDIELLHFSPTAGETCGTYMAGYMAKAGGYLIDEASTSACEFCALADTNVFLKAISYNYANRWRDFGLMWCYIAFNIAAATGIYYIARVPKKQKEEKVKKE